MGLFDFVSDITSAAVKVALTPVAVVKDVANIAMDEEVDATSNLLDSAGEDLDNAIDEIFD